MYSLRVLLFISCISLSLQAMNQNQIEVNAQKQFSIELEAKPSTGYRWYPQYDSKFIEFNEESDVKYEAEVKPGSSGKQKFYFTAQKPGNTEITFLYQRPWEVGKELPKKTEKYNITIDEC